MEPLTQYSQSKDTDVDTYELEARFGNQLTKLDYNHVIQWLLLSGFTLEDATGKDILRIGYKKTTENIRIEINGIKAIQRYCKTQQLVNPTFGKKKQVSRHEISNWWTTIALSLETTITEVDIAMKPSSYRFMNRVRLTSKDHAFYYDCSIVRTSESLDTLFTKDPSYEIEALMKNDDLFKGEAADLIFHLLVLLEDRGIGLEEIVKTLQARHQK